MDPRFHADEMGLLLRSGPGDHDAPVTLDTTALSPGWHRIVVHSGRRIGERENGGAFLLPFLVC